MIDTSSYVNRKRPEEGVSFEPPQETSMVRPNAAPTQGDPMAVRPNQAPVEGVSTELPKDNATFSSTPGNNATAYINKTSATLGSDPGYTTEAGAIRAKRITDGLTKPDASSVNAQNTADTNAARREYLARMDAQERAAQSGFAQGSAQSTRIFDQSQAGTNAANQSGQSAVNAYVRQRTEDNMRAAGELEGSQHIKGRENLNDAIGADIRAYGRNENATDRGLAAAALTYSKGRDALGDSRYDQTYSDSRGDVADSKARTARQDAISEDQRAIENAAVAKNGTDAEKRNLINSLPDGPAKNAVMAGLANGTMTVADALSKVMNPDGSIKDGTEGGGVNYRGKTPESLGLEASRERAVNNLRLKAEEDGGVFDETSPAGIRAIAAEVSRLRQAIDQPVNDAEKERVATEIKAKMDTGAALTETEEQQAIKAGLIPPLTMATIPAGADNVTNFLKDNPSGKFAIDGEVYTLVKGSDPRTGRTEYANNPRHTSVAEIKDAQGNTKYYYSGAIHDAPPKEVGDVQITPFGW